MRSNVVGCVLSVWASLGRLGVVARGRLPLLEADRELLAVEAVERHPGADAVALVVAAVRVALAVDGEARLGVAEQGLLALRGA